MGDDPLADRAEQRLGEAAVATIADHEQLGAGTRVGSVALTDRTVAVRVAR